MRFVTRSGMSKLRNVRRGMMPRVPQISLKKDLEYKNTRKAMIAYPNYEIAGDYLLSMSLTLFFRLFACRLVYSLMSVARIRWVANAHPLEKSNEAISE